MKSKIVFGFYEETTDGKKSLIMLYCPFCNVLTDGAHEINCPNYQPIIIYSYT